MRNLTWLAAIALAVGCAHSRQDDYIAQQQQAAQSQQAAADAQQRAIWEQQKANQANQDAASASQDAAQQRQYAVEQNQRAAQAQADASNAQAQASQQSVHLYAAPANAPVIGTAQVIEGQVLNASDDTVTLRTLHSGTVNLAISDQTRITLDGEPVGRASNLTPGEDVRASFQVIDGQPQALHIRAHAGMSPIPQTH